MHWAEENKSDHVGSLVIALLKDTRCTRWQYLVSRKVLNNHIFIELFLNIDEIYYKYLYSYLLWFKQNKFSHLITTQNVWELWR